jgi:hypothetical protein
MVGLMCVGATGRGEREAMVKEKVSGPSIKEAPVVHTRGLVGMYLGSRSGHTEQKKLSKIGCAN